MSEILTADKSLPSTISIPTKEIDGHTGNTTVVSQLTVSTSIIGDIKVENGGELIVEGFIKGNIINHGTVSLLKGGKIEGSIDNFNFYDLAGIHIGPKMNLLSGSLTIISGTGKLDIHSEKGAKMQVENSAKIEKFSNATMQNSGDINISGQSVEKSLVSSGTVTVTGSVTFQ